MSITGMVKVCTVRIKLPIANQFHITFNYCVGGNFMIIVFVKLLITLKYNDIFTSNKDYLIPYSQTIYLIPSLTNLVDQQMR